VVVKMFDYTCSHCRTLHEQLEAARRRYGDELAVIVVPAPLHSGCNRHASPAGDGPHKFSCVYARLALTVYCADRTKFAAFHQWLFEPSSPPSTADARARAVQLVGERAFDDASGDPRVSQMLDQCVAMYGAAGGDGVPKLLTAGAIIHSARFTSEDQLFKELEQQLGIESRHK
jgi:protein-disulfide isomerase